MRTMSLTDESTADHRITWRVLVARVADLVVSLWRHEPTVFVEVSSAWIVGCWSVSTLLWGLSRLPAEMAGRFGLVPETALGMSGLAITTTMIAAMVARHTMARAYGSMAAAMWMGFVGAAIIATDYRLPGGPVYLGLAVLSLLPFWRAVLGRRL